MAFPNRFYVRAAKAEASENNQTIDYNWDNATMLSESPIAFSHVKVSMVVTRPNIFRKSFYEAFLRNAINSIDEKLKKHKHQIDNLSSDIRLFFKKLLNFNWNHFLLMQHFFSFMNSNYIMLNSFLFYSIIARSISIIMTLNVSLNEHNFVRIESRNKWKSHF